MTVWELNTQEINCSPYYLPEEGKAEQFIELMQIIDDENKPIADVWEPLILLKSEQCIDPDFLDLYNTGSLILSQRSAELLPFFLQTDDYELLPFLHDEKSMYLFRLFKFTDALDKENSEFTALDNGIILDYEQLVFDYEKIAYTPLFKIPELPYTCFVTSAFKYFYDEQELKGLDFDDENIVYED